jgi:hypothetical protein
MILGNLLMILVIVHHGQWDQVIPQEKFAYNDSSNMSTSKSPFQILYGMHPRGIFELRNFGQDEFQSVAAEDFVVEMQRLHDQIRGQLQNRNQRYKNRVDQKMREVNFELRDQVI